EQKKGAPVEEIRKMVEIQFYKKTSEWQGYLQLEATKNRLSKELRQCKNTPLEESIKQAYDQASIALKKASDPYKTPEYRAYDQLWYYLINNNWIKTYTEKFQKNEQEMQQKVCSLAEQNQVIVNSFTASCQTTNASHSIQQREQKVNAFIRQKLAQDTPIETIKQELGDQFCKHIPEHHAVGVLDSNKLRLREAFEPCWKAGYFGDMEYCYALEEEYEQYTDNLRRARKERNHTPEMQALQKLSDYSSNEAAIEKLKKKHAERAEKIKQAIQEEEQKNEKMFSEAS
ncbi:MAG TPA: hypothetical protein VJJ26_01300, partial [Candidatus Babeliales bacterium]|nr:hypothetical protein [Candidatus Babeliales bacterium]